MPQLSFHTPLGALTLSEEDGAIVALDWGFGRDQTPTALLSRGRDRMQAYFDGEIERFDLPLAPNGTAYRKRVWQALLAIPYGQTASYGGLAASVGGSARAIGGANAANPIPIIIPCHRVVASAGLSRLSRDAQRSTPKDGARESLLSLSQERKLQGVCLGGYSGGNGIETKTWLLALEQGARQHPAHPET